MRQSLGGLAGQRRMLFHAGRGLRCLRTLQRGRGWRGTGAGRRSCGAGTLHGSEGIREGWGQSGFVLASRFGTEWVRDDAQKTDLVGWGGCLRRRRMRWWCWWWWEARGQ